MRMKSYTFYTVLEDCIYFLQLIHIVNIRKHILFQSVHEDTEIN
jgi:hypothetical protein